MSEDKVESRMDGHLKIVLAVIDKSDHPDRGELRGIVKAVFEQATRPSVPAQGQACRACEEGVPHQHPKKIASQEARNIAEQIVTQYCDCDAGNFSELVYKVSLLVESLAASRSEAAPAQKIFHDFLPLNQFVRLVREMFIAIHDGIELTDEKKWEWLKLLNESAGAPAAGSAERAAAKKFVDTFMRLDSNTPLSVETGFAIRELVKALAGADTDVAKEK